MRRIAIAALIAASTLTAAVAEAKTLRWASQGDILTFDPHSQNEGLNNSANSYVYEPLINYNEKFELEPALAVNWKQETTLIWRFNLRKGVKWHDGSPFTAADVVFSIDRALAPSSNFKAYTFSIQRAVAVDDHHAAFVPRAALGQDADSVAMHEGRDVVEACLSHGPRLLRQAGIAGRGHRLGRRPHRQQAQPEHGEHDQHGHDERVAPWSAARTSNGFHGFASVNRLGVSTCAVRVVTRA
jgi:hypothetical protein